MKRILLLLIAIATLGLPSAYAIKLSDYTPYKYEVLFTNPVCRTYSYDSPLITPQGNTVRAKAKNAYCKGSDSRASANRPNAPHQRLIDWIKDTKTKEIFMAYLSFSKSSIVNALCDAIEERNIKVTLVMDKGNEARQGGMAKANQLKSCGGDKVHVMTGGHTGSGRNETGYAHNKLFFVNPDSATEVKIAFSSGNMSSGTTTHHENWHFVTTSGASYFAEIHRCLKEGVLNHDRGIRHFSDFIGQCRSEIEVAEESDIKVYFVPGEGRQAMNQIHRAIRNSESVDLAAHRFSNSSLISALENGLRAGKPMRLVVDDDMHWTGVYRRGMGRNMTHERRRVNQLQNSGLEVKYIETYADAVFDARRVQLQHNKFLIFNFPNNRGAVFAGAGNLTNAAFRKNYENFYYITIPSVYEAFVKQYDLFWNDLGRSASELPEELELP